jgi:hypothetical protein
MSCWIRCAFAGLLTIALLSFPARSFPPGAGGLTPHSSTFESQALAAGTLWWLHGTLLQAGETRCVVQSDLVSFLFDAPPLIPSGLYDILLRSATLLLGIGSLYMISPRIRHETTKRLPARIQVYLLIRELETYRRSPANHWPNFVRFIWRREEMSQLLGLSDRDPQAARFALRPEEEELAVAVWDAATLRSRLDRTLLEGPSSVVYTLALRPGTAPKTWSLDVHQHRGSLKGPAWARRRAGKFSHWLGRQGRPVARLRFQWDSAWPDLVILRTEINTRCTSVALLPEVLRVLKNALNGPVRLRQKANNEQAVLKALYDFLPENQRTPARLTGWQHLEIGRPTTSGTTFERAHTLLYEFLQHRLMRSNSAPDPAGGHFWAGLQTLMRPLLRSHPFVLAGIPSEHLYLSSDKDGLWLEALPRLRDFLWLRGVILVGAYRVVCDFIEKYVNEWRTVPPIALIGAVANFAKHGLIDCVGVEFMIRTWIRHPLPSPQNVTAARIASGGELPLERIPGTQPFYEKYLLAALRGSGRMSDLLSKKHPEVAVDFDGQPLLRWVFRSQQYSPAWGPLIDTLTHVASALKHDKAPRLDAFPELKDAFNADPKGFLRDTETFLAQLSQGTPDFRFLPALRSAYESALQSQPLRAVALSPVQAYRATSLVRANGLSEREVIDILGEGPIDLPRKLVERISEAIQRFPVAFHRDQRMLLRLAGLLSAPDRVARHQALYQMMYDDTLFAPNEARPHQRTFFQFGTVLFQSAHIDDADRDLFRRLHRFFFPSSDLIPALPTTERSA